MEIFIKIVQFFLSLSILIILHEFGHYATARLFKIRVEKFYLFFNPWFSIFKIKNGETEYGLGWLPLGGYVKIAGMIDESMDKEQMKQPPQPWEFRSKPAWQRLIVMVAGVFMNLILAIAIYILLLFFLGETFLPTKNLKYGIAVDSAGYEIGLRNGDKILSIDNEYVENFREIPVEIIFNSAKTIQVDRSGDTMDVNIPDGFIGQLLSSKNLRFIEARIPFIINGFFENSPAQAAGFMIDDQIIAINNTPIEFFDEFKTEIQKLKNEDVYISVLRNEAVVDLSMTIPETAVLGIYPKTESSFFELKSIEYSFIQAIPAGFVKAYKTIVDYIRQLRLLFTSKEVKASENLGGFITIGNIFSPTWDWIHFWSITALLSVILAFMNILPIPALDGGHVIFLLYEVITRRKPNEKVLEYSQYVGLAILLLLVLYANVNDVIRLFK
ncbi:MAG: RIP metalloprotease RseP [Bacteroidales bacterium]|nr:RIP metalloprotease RseP [Bacteroidales bacterium]